MPTKNILTNWQEEVALARYRLIAPLLDESLDQAARVRLRKDIAEREDISERTLRRYEAAYKTEGFPGLNPADRSGVTSKRLPDNFDELLAEAIQLKREVPKRSVSTIIFILEQEGHVAPGVLKRSTLERHLYEAGFGVRQMQMYNDARETSARRFCKPHRMMLLQSDIKYGPYLPIGKNGAMAKTYLSSLIDDHSRYVLQSSFYATQDETIVEDTFRKAILKWGKFDAAYLDNGSQYIAKQLKFSLARLGISVRHTPLNAGQAKGKVEKLHQVVDAYLEEAKAHKIRTLEDLNFYWAIFLEDFYHNRPHSGIKEYYEGQGVSVPEEGITPLQEWGRDTRPLTFLDTAVVAEAFLHHEERRVDKGACISFRGKKYETKSELIGCKVEIAYDPMAPESITVRYKGTDPFQAKPLKIGEFSDKKPPIPVSMGSTDPEVSRLLAVLEKNHASKQEQRADAISFGGFRKDGGSDV